MELDEIYKEFPTQESCIAFLEKLRWGGHPKCPYCFSLRHSDVKKSVRYHCNNCNSSYSVTVGTMFHKTKVDIQKWMLLIQYNLSTKKLPSYRELSDIMGVTKDTVSRMLKEFRNSVAKQDVLIQKLLDYEKSKISKSDA